MEQGPKYIICDDMDVNKEISDSDTKELLVKFRKLKSQSLYLQSFSHSRNIQHIIPYNYKENRANG